MACANTSYVADSSEGPNPRPGAYPTQLRPRKHCLPATFNSSTWAYYRPSPALFLVCRCEDVVADNCKARSQLFLTSPQQPLDQAPFLRVIDSGDAAAQQASSIVLALLIVVRVMHVG